jgi:hypothetical protein
MARAFGIPGQHNTPTKKTTLTFEGHKVSYTRKTWHGNPIGWKVWIDGIKYFSNLLTSSEAIESCLKKHKEMV